MQSLSGLSKLLTSTLLVSFSRDVDSGLEKFEGDMQIWGNVAYEWATVATSGRCVCVCVCVCACLTCWWIAAKQIPIN